MNGSLVAGLVRGWVDLYTRGLPADARTARRDEIDDDLWCEQAEAAAAGRSARSLDADLALRLMFGIPSDISWRLTRHRAPDPAILKRSASTSTRTLGLLAIVGGSSVASLVVLSLPMGGALLTSGAFFLPGVSMIALIATALGLAWRFHDYIGPLGMVGAFLVAIGSALPPLMAQPTPVTPFFAPTGAIAAGSAMLMWDLAQIGVLSRRAAIMNLATAIPLIGLAVANLTEPVNALGVALIPPFAVSWVAIGVSLMRGMPRAQATSG